MMARSYGNYEAYLKEIEDQETTQGDAEDGAE
jgi:hypothetical protein